LAYLPTTGRKRTRSKRPKHCWTATGLPYGHRLTFISQEDPTKISTLVTWDSNEIYDAWRASPERATAMHGAAELWSKPAESERFEMAD